MRDYIRLSGLIFLLLLAAPVHAQSRTETLADIRQELSFLYVEIQQLKQELSTTGISQPLAGGTEIQRLDALEGELQRITGKVERLQFRIENIVKDGTNRIGDLEFRLVELEGGDTSKLGETTTLGGKTQKIDTPTVPADQTTTGDLAVSEKVDYDTAKAAYDKGEFKKSADLMAAFAKTYPGSPLMAGAYYWRGESFASLNQWTSAARSFLKSFSGTPDSDFAPRALYRLGVSLDKIGQRDEACLTLKEVGARYPGSQSETDAKQQMAALACTG